jgi:hypothetical protein
VVAALIGSADITGAALERDLGCGLLMRGSPLPRRYTITSSACAGRPSSAPSEAPVRDRREGVGGLVERSVIGR